MHNKHRVSQLLVILLAGIALTTLLLATRWGIGTSPDSIAYIKSARNFWAESLSSPNAALVFRPPFYPMLLAALGLTGTDPFVAARWLNAVIYAANILLVGIIIWRYQPRSPWLAVCGALLTLGAMPLLEIHVYAWTEPLFILLGYTGLAILARYLESEKVRWLLATAILFALATLTRYAGISFLMTGCIALLLLGRGRWWKRIWLTLLFGLVAALPVALWMARNTQTDQLAGGRSFAFHPVGRDHFWQAVFTLSDWLQMPAATPGVVRVGLLGAIGVTAVILLIVRFTSSSRSNIPNVAGIPVFYKLLLIFLPVYILFLITSVSFLDAATPFDNRILSPVYVACIFLALFLLEELFHQTHRWRMAQITVVIVLTIFLMLSAIRNGRWLLEASRYGLGFSSAAWQQADIIAQIKMLPADTLIFSNIPDAVYFLADRPASPLPRKFEATTQQVNTSYNADLANVAEQIDQEDGVVVYFYALRGNSALPATQELTDTLSLHLLKETAEGAIYGGQ